MPPGDPRPFDDLDHLRREHGGLLTAVRGAADPTADPGGRTQRVTDFLARARATGARLDFPPDREAAQSVLDYWTATLFTLPNGLSTASALPAAIAGAPDGANLRLDPFDPAELRGAVAAADAWLARPDADAVLARRTLLRLVRLRADGPEFDAVPTVTAALADLDTRERVDAVLAALSKAGVVRVAPAGAEGLERVALRAPALQTEWPALAGWLADRKAFRGSVERWAAAGKPGALLAEGARLDDARRYHDRNAAEREFVVASAYRETRQLEQAAADRRAKWVLGAVAAAALIGWIVAAVGWGRSAVQAGELKTANADLKQALGDLKTANAKLAAESKALEKANARIAREAEAAAALANFEIKSRAAVALVLTNSDADARHVAKKILIVQSLGQVLFANAPDEHAQALASWQQLRAKIKAEAQSERGKRAGAEEDWFEWFLGRRDAAVQTVTTTYPATPAAQDTMIDLSKAFRKVIRGSGERAYLAPLDSLRPIWYEQVERVTDKLVADAAAGRSVAEVRVFANLFWRLYSCELVLVEDTPVENAMVAFGNQLRAWEQAADQKADGPTADALRAEAAKLRDLFRTPGRAVQP